MKIIYLSNSIIPSQSANSIQVMKMCQAFSNNGHEVVLVAPKIKKSQIQKNAKNVFKFYGVKKNFKIKRFWYPSVKGGSIIYTLAIFFYLIKNKSFNLIYGRFLYGCYVSALLRFEVIFESHNFILKSTWLQKFVFKKLIKHKFSRKLIVISKALKNMYLKNINLSETSIQVAHDGADEILDFKTKINLLGNKKSLQIGYLGHLYKGRGIEIIINCAKKLSSNMFHIVGGKTEDVEYWKNYSKSLNLKNIFFYGFVNPKDTIKYLNSFDILLAPYSKKVSVSGNIGDTSKIMSPIKIFEYMSRKKPIIISDLPVIREVLNDKNSILVPTHDLKMWVNSIKKLKNMKSNKLINQAYADFKNYTWSKRASLVLKMNICIISPSFSGGGSEDIAIKSANYYFKENNNVIFISFKKKGILKKRLNKDIPIKYVKDENFLNLSFQKVMNSFRFDHTISFLRHANVSAFFASKIGGIKTNKLHLIEVNTFDKLNELNFFKKIAWSFLIKISYRFCDDLIAVSRLVKKQIQDNFKISNNVRVVGNPCVDLKEIKKTKKKNIYKHTKFVSAARLEPQKDFLTMLKAFRDLKKSNKKNLDTLTIYGAGKEYWKINKFIKENNLSRFVTIKDFTNKLFEELTYYDCFILSSKYEGFGNVIVIALSAGLPVIAKKNSGGPDDLINKKNGFLFKDKKDLSNILQNFNYNKFKKYDLKKNAEKYSIEKICSKYLDNNV